MVVAFLQSSSTPLIQSDLLPTVFQAGLAGLNMEHPGVLNSLIEFYRRLLGISISVDELVPGLDNRSAFGQNAARIVSLLRQFGSNFVKLLFEGMIFHYPWEMISDVASILKSLSQLLPEESTQWLMAVVNGLQDASLKDRNEFLESYIK